MCYVPAAGLGGRTGLEPSQASEAGVDQRCDTVISGGPHAQEGVISSNPLSTGHRKHGFPLFCVCVEIIMKYLL